MVSADGNTYAYDLQTATCGIVISVGGAKSAADYAVPALRVLVADLWKRMDVEIEWGFGLTEYLIGARAPFDEQYNRILTELNEARFRAKEYKLAVEKLDDDATIPDDVLPFVAPLVFVVRGSQQPRVLLGAPFINTPDLTTPITAANQYSAFSELVARRYEYLLGYLKDEVEKRIDQVTTFGPYVILGAVAIGAAILFRR